jgi:hypothetical protein
VFKSYSKTKLFKELGLYFLLWALLATLSGTIVGLFNNHAIHFTLLFKVFVGTCLFFLASYMQKNFIFNIYHKTNPNT